MGNDYVSVQVHRLNQDGHNELLDDALLLVVDDYAHMCAFIDVMTGERLISDSLVIGHRPIVV